MHHVTCTLVGALSRVCHEHTVVPEARKQSPNCGAHGLTTQRGINLDNGDSSQLELLSDKWSPNALVNMMSVNNTFENVSSGHGALASHL